MPAVEPLRIPTLLDTVLPDCDERTIHGRPVRASVAAVAAAIRDTPLQDARFARALMALRTGGRSLRGERGTIARLGDGVDGVVALAESPTEVVVGFAGQPWPGGERAVELEDGEAWRALVPHDLVKVAFSLRCGEATYGTLVVTETRILVGELARQPFGRYWKLIRPGSGLVRGSLLRAIARRAERGA